MTEPQPNMHRDDTPGKPWRAVIGVAVLAGALGVIGTLAVVAVTEQAGSPAPPKAYTEAAPTEIPDAPLDTTTTTAPSTTTTSAAQDEAVPPPTVTEPDAGDEREPEFDEPIPVATFDVRGDTLVVEDVAPELGERATTVWNRFVDLVPSDQRSMVSAFELMDAEYEGAHVYPTDADPTRWVLGVSEGLGLDLDETLLHEWGHLVTLSASEVPPNENAAGCKTYFTGEGCALPDSTFARFVAAFWSQEMIDEADRISMIEPENEYFDAIDAFLARYEGEFVTDYATTNAGEDLAETISVFILNDRPDGDEVKDDKLRFLWDDPVFVERRERIRENL